MVRHRSWFIVLAVAAVAPAPAAPGPGEDGAVPVAPIMAAEFLGWTNAFILRNGACRTVLAPDAGRLVCYQPAGSTNLLQLASDLLGRSADDPRHRFRWANFGGEWLWTVDQPHWPELRAQAAPARLLDGQRWESRAWRTADGNQLCEMSLTLAAPVSARVTRRYRLAPKAPCLSVDQSMERTGPGGMPLVLWNVCRVTRPQAVIVPDEPGGGGPRADAFDPPPDEAWYRKDGMAVFRVGRGREHRMIAPAAAPWIAAQWDGHLLLMMQAAPAESPMGGAPGPGSAAFYAGWSAAYAEIELKTAEANPAEGETLRNQICYRYYPLPMPVTLDELIARIRTHLDDAPEAEPGAPPPLAPAAR